MMSYIKWNEWRMLCDYAWYGYLPRCNMYSISRSDRIAAFQFYKNLKRRSKDIKEIQNQMSDSEVISW